MTYLSILVILFWLSAGVAAGLLAYRPRLAAPLLPAASLLQLLLLLPARGALLPEATAGAPTAAVWPGWQWEMSEGAWWLNLAFLLLLLGGGLARWARAEPAAQPLEATALPLVLAAAVLTATSAGSAATLVAGWLLLDGVWCLLLLRAAPAAEGSSALRRLFFLGLGPLLLWLALLTLPQLAGTVGLDLRGWPPLTRSLLLLAATVQLGAFPLHFWRPGVRAWPALTAALALAAPAVAGATLLVRLEAAADISQAFALPLTLAALLGLLWAGKQAWDLSDTSLPLAAALSLAQAGLLLLAATWTGADATLGEARVLILGAGLLLLAARQPRRNLLTTAAVALALAALAGLPLTAGFGGRSAVYAAWMSDGRWLLVLVTALLHVPLLAAGLLLLRDADQETPAWRQLPQSRRAALGGAGLLLPALGLLGVSGLGSASLGSWLALLLPPVAAFLLVYYLEETAAIRQMVQEAITLPLNVRPLFAPLRRAVAFLFSGLQEAAAILEGERGLLWLLFFLLIIWLVR